MSTCAICGAPLNEDNRYRGTNLPFCGDCGGSTPDISAECAVGEHADCAGDVWLDDGSAPCTCGCHALVALAVGDPQWEAS